MDTIIYYRGIVKISITILIMAAYWGCFPTCLLEFAFQSVSVCVCACEHFLIREKGVEFASAMSHARLTHLWCIFDLFCLSVSPPPPHTHILTFPIPASHIYHTPCIVLLSLPPVNGLSVLVARAFEMTYERTAYIRWSLKVGSALLLLLLLLASRDKLL